MANFPTVFTFKAEEIWKPSHKFGYRGIVKKGPLELIKLNEAKKKIAKRKQVEVMLFSDIFLFCKPVKVKKTGRVEMIVIKEAHRSLLDVDRFRSSGAQVVRGHPQALRADSS